ncbi:MAG: hypothetical protein R3293_28040, partial [Candidatus Promineifilaceae bacterium]|nr:hypothetical protein [Candidatus Promineifilaceae bacterium]
LDDQFNQIRPGFDEPKTANLLQNMLRNGDPRERLRALGPLSQWGQAGLGLLADAATDNNPLVATTAMYALLHAGETRLVNDQELPLEPLFSPDNTFQCVGGCRMSIGPLTYIDAPQSLRVKLRVTIKHLDFDLFATPARIELWSIPAHWYAADLLERSREVNWPRLLGQLLFISRLSHEVQNVVRRRNGLQVIVDELQRRERDYAALAYFLSRDLGLLEYSGLGYYGDADLSAHEKIYRRMRYIYGLSNRERFLEPGGAANVTAIASDMVLESVQDSANVTGIQINSNEDSFPENQAERFFLHDVSMNVEQCRQGSVTGIEYGDYFESNTSLPFAARAQVNLNVEKVAGSTITGIRIKRLLPAAGGALFDVNVHLKHMRGSSFTGVQVEMVSASN